MNELENVERDLELENREKKSVGISAFKKGKHGKTCTLRQEKMTPKQLEKENGEMATYNYKSPMTWTEFKWLPNDIQQMHIDYVCNTFGVAGPSIARIFGISTTPLYDYLKKHCIKIPKVHTGKLSEDRKRAFDKWMNKEAEEEEVIDIPAPEPEEKNSFVCWKSESAPPIGLVDEGRFSLNGTTTDLINLMETFPALADYHFDISFTKL